MYQFPFSFFFPLLIIFMFMILSIMMNRSAGTKNLPPGPHKLPVIGNMHQLIGSMPHHGLTYLAKRYGPLMHLKLGEISTIVVSSPESAKEVLHTHGTIFAERPFLLTSTVFSYDSTGISSAPYGDYWRKMRKICTLELLSVKRVRSFRSIREEEVSGYVNSISSNAGLAVNISKRIYHLSSEMMTRAAFGRNLKGQLEQVVPFIQEALLVGGGFSFAEFFPSIKFLQQISGIRPRMEDIHRRIDEILQTVVNEHLARRVMAKNGEIEDLVDVLLDIKEDGDLEFTLTTDNIKAVLLVL